MSDEAMRKAIIGILAGPPYREFAFDERADKILEAIRKEDPRAAAVPRLYLDTPDMPPSVYRTLSVENTELRQALAEAKRVMGNQDRAWKELTAINERVRARAKEAEARVAELTESAHEIELRVDDRTLTVVERPDGTHAYLATWFTKERTLRLQEGLMTDVAGSLRWLLTSDPAKAERLDARGSQWIACSERMPERMAVVIVMERGGDRPCCAQWFTYKVDGKERISWHQDSEHVEADSGNYGNGANRDHRDLDVTHWMPLPPGPDGAKPGGDGAAEKNRDHA